MNLDLKLEWNEIKFSLIGLGILYVWFMYVKDAIAPMLDGMLPFFAFVIFNTGFFLGIFFLTAPLNGKKTRWTMTFISLMAMVGWNIINGPYLVSKEGVINHAVDFWYVSGDAAFASLWQQFTSGPIIYLLTYIVTPVIFVVATAYLLAPRQVAKLWGGH